MKEKVVTLFGMSLMLSFGFLALFAKIMGIHLERLGTGKFVAGFIALFIVDLLLLLSMGREEKRIVNS